MSPIQSPPDEAALTPAVAAESEVVAVEPQGSATETPAPIQRRLSIDELEHLLMREDEVALEILPNGEIRQKGAGEAMNLKPLTMRERLGGEYA